MNPERIWPVYGKTAAAVLTILVAVGTVGHLLPVALTLMLKLTPMAPACYVLALAGMGVLVGCWLLREAGKQALLKQVSAQ